MSNERYRIIPWPEVQDLMDEPDFDNNAYLVNDERGIEDWGTSAYFVDEGWLKSRDNKKEHA